MFDEGYAERDASWEGVKILFLAGFMLVTKRKGVGTSAYEICLISVGDGCHAVPDNRIGGCWQTMAGFPFKNFLMQGRVTNPSVRRRSQIVAGFNPIRFALMQVQLNSDFNACAYDEVDGYYEIGENGRMNIRYIHFKFGDLAVKNLARSGNRRERGSTTDNRIGGCWETMAGFPYKNFLMQGRVRNPPVRSRSQIVARFNPIRFAQGQVQRNPAYN